MEASDYAKFEAMRDVGRSPKGVTSAAIWESEDAIRRFAGSELEKAKYYPEDAEFLLELEPTVTHYEVLIKP